MTSFSHRQKLKLVKFSARDIFIHCKMIGSKNCLNHSCYCCCLCMSDLRIFDISNTQKRLQTPIFGWPFFSCDCSSDFHFHNLFSFSFALIVHQDLAIMMGERDHCAKPSLAHPKDSHWRKNLDCDGQFISCSLIHSFINESL